LGSNIFIIPFFFSIIGSINEPLFEKIENKINNNADANKLLKSVLNLFLSKNLVIIQPRNAKQMK
jgi:hypothetical protein